RWLCDRSNICTFTVRYLCGEVLQPLAGRSSPRTRRGSFHYGRAFQRFASQIGDATLKFFYELALPAAKRVCPRFDSVFVNRLVIKRAYSAPTIVIGETHRRFPPCAFPEDAPLQNGGHHVVPVLKDVCFNAEIFANDPLYRIMPAVE